VGQTRQSKIVTDVIEYHASTDSLIELGEQSDVDMVAFYHLVPVPPNFVIADIFKRGVPDNFLLAEDLMSFELPIDSDDILVTRP
jgi:ribonuclease Z